MDILILRKRGSAAGGAASPGHGGDHARRRSRSFASQGLCSARRAPRQDAADGAGCFSPLLWYLSEPSSIKAEKDLTHGMLLDPENTKGALFHRALAYLGLGLHSLAHQDITNFLVAKPDNAQALSILALAQKGMK